MRLMGQGSVSAVKQPAEEKAPVILPVRRKLMAVTVCYLLGIYLTAIALFPVPYMAVLCVLLLVWIALRSHRRKHTLLLVMLLMLLLGNLRAGCILQKRDLPTAYGVHIEGTVQRVISPSRVMLKDVAVRTEEKEKALLRPAMVSLMSGEEEGEEARQGPVEGQFVQGTGRLFAPEAPRNKGESDSRIQALCEGYELSGYLQQGWTMRGEGTKTLSSCLRQLREKIGSCIEGLFGGQAPLYRAILLGDRSGLDRETTAAMRMTGTAHILTVSGLHLSMIAGAVGLLLKRIPIGRVARFIVMSAFLLFFTGLTGAAPGTIRACIMAMLREYALVRGRRYEPLSALSCAALMMTLAMPLWALNASFQFSFFVVLGIHLFASGATSGFERLAGGSRLLLPLKAAWLCVVAQLAAVPMQLLLYGYVPLLSLPMNMLCSMMMPIVLTGGWIVTVIGLLCPQTAGALAGWLGQLSAGFEQISLQVASMEHAIVRLPAPHGLTVLLFAGLMLLLTDRIPFGRWRRQAAGMLCCGVLLGYMPRLNPSARYAQLDVGQGDAALLANGRSAVLVDVGPEDSYAMLRYLRHEGLLVDAVILSHLDEDHAGALETLLSSEIAIPRVIIAQEEAWKRTPSQAVSRLQSFMEQKGIALQAVKAGDCIEAGGIALDVLAPDESHSGSNERSLVLYADLQGVTFLLTGDLPWEAEPATVPPADVLKVAHHGSKNASSDRFLRQVRPKLAIISVGASNRYGHPAERVLASLEQVDARILRTDELGGIELWIRRDGYDIETRFTPENP